MSQNPMNPFRETALDRSITVPEVFDRTAKHSPDHPLFIFETGSSLKILTWKQVVNAMHHVARDIIQTIGNVDQETKPMVGVMASIDPITHFTLTFGVIRAGFPVFQISTRNSAAAVAHLLTKTNCYHLFVSDDAAMQSLSANAASMLENRDQYLSILKIPRHSDMYLTSDAEADPLPPVSVKDMDAVAAVLHSSGSTSFPKPIFASHRIMMHWIRHPLFADGDISQDTLAIHALPMHHAMGFITSQWSASTGMSLSCFPPVFPPVQPTADAILQSVIATKSTLIYSVPSFIEHWVQKPENITFLSQLKALVFAGAPLSNAVGNLLAKNSVPMVHVYGSTEIGGGTKFIPKIPQKEDWCYFHFSPNCNLVFVPQDDEDLYELVFLEGPDHKPCVFNSVINGQPAFSTNDLLVRHPDTPNLWKIYGRKDDQIMLSNGEKTNPGPIETILCRDPRVAFAVVFGRGREQNGVVIQPRPGYEFDPSNPAALASFRNHIWPTVVQANSFAPSHSRLFKEMIIVAHPSKPFDLTTKGTPRRPFVIASYEQEIEQAYKAVEESSQGDLAPPSEWNDALTLEFVRTAVHRTLHKTVDDEADLFQHGCDSLQGTWIRNTILHALKRSSNVSIRQISQNLVYENPTISALARYIAKLVSSPLNVAPRNIEEVIEQMQLLVAEFSHDFSQHQASASAPNGDVVVLTGSTGALGSHLLAQLISHPAISRVYALNRTATNGQTIHERQESSFDDKGLDVSLLSSSKLVLVEADIVLPRFGMDLSLYEEIRSSVTHIIHVAWRVDFNISLSTLKPMIQGTRNLIDLALSSPLPSPPAFAFISSVSVLRNWGTSDPVPEVSVEARIAVGSGYSESKWVAEELLSVAAQKTALRPLIVRTDQLSGSANGAWNVTDSIPAIVRSGQALGCLPDRPDNVVWLPVHIAAASILEIRNSPAQYLHVRNSHPAPWHSIFNVFSAELDVRLVPYAEWLSRLVAAHDKTMQCNSFDADAVRSNPATFLLGFFESIAGERGAGMTLMDISGMLRESSSLAQTDLQTALSEAEIKKWIKYWKLKGLLDE